MSYDALRRDPFCRATLFAPEEPSLMTLIAMEVPIHPDYLVHCAPAQGRGGGE